MKNQTGLTIGLVVLAIAAIIGVGSIIPASTPNQTKTLLVSKAEAQSTQYAINPGDTISVTCNTDMHITPIDGNTVDILCDPEALPTATVTNTEVLPTPTDVPTNTPVDTATVIPTNTSIPTATKTPTSVPTPTNTATNTPVNTPTNTPVVNADCVPPYTANGPWNKPIGSNPVYDANSSTYVGLLGGTFGSDPTQFTMALYYVDSNTPLKKVTLSGVYSDVQNDTSINKGAKSITIPIPDGAKPANGSDAQFIMWNRSTGDEWGFNGVVANADGSYSVKNGYHYNTNWDGSPPSGFGSRGAGVPYLTGLIRPCEIAQGHIDHAIAFAFDTPSSSFVFPATKSDGSGSTEMPEGARLQLDPSLTDAQIKAWGCTGSCLIIAHALQTYGMIVIDKSGHPKIYAEYEGTAHWNGVVNANTPKTIPYSAFKVLKLN